ncbi:MAG: RsmB/NOP family class I SAM-dependent RNA methyltransferase [Clostridia bacterium]|nr:RsmB/NOP family class I SAM-dependent RNA methyltransferase [Clostridia bacterium]
MNLPQDFLNRMQSRSGEEYGDFLASYSKPAVKGVRVNTLKISVEEFNKISPFAVSPVPWTTDGFYIAEEKAGKFIEHFAGLYYVQEPSAMCAAPLLNAGEGENVLDLCSAPGGKGTQLAQSMHGEGVLVLNEINFSRAKILSQNVERLGVRNAAVTVADPEALAKAYAGCFDKVLVDAPCSGEGMFKKEPAAIPEWSLKNVEMCAERQRKILASADKLLRTGGTLVYSTCTFAEEEDEWQIEKFLTEHPEYRLVKTEKLYPHKVKGEGHFAAVLQKCDGEINNFSPSPAFKDSREKLYRSFESDFLPEKFDNLYLAGDTLYSLPQGMPVFKVQTLRAGVRLGEFENGRFTPSHSLAMCLKRGVDGVELDVKSAYDYLKGLTVSCPASYTGWKAATYKGFLLGWCKCSNGTAKNHYPKGLRIR